MLCERTTPMNNIIIPIQNKIKPEIPIEDFNFPLPINKIPPKIPKINPQMEIVWYNILRWDLGEIEDENGEEEEEGREEIFDIGVSNAIDDDEELIDEFLGVVDDVNEGFCLDSDLDDWESSVGDILLFNYIDLKLWLMLLCILNNYITRTKIYW